MNKLLEYQLKTIGFDGKLDRTECLTFLNMVNESYDKSDDSRAYQRDMLDAAKIKLKELYRTHNEGKNKQTQEKYEQLLLNLQPYYFFYTKSKEGRFVFISDTVKNMLGFSTEEFIDKYGETFAYGLRSDIETKILISEYGFNVPYQLSLESKNGLQSYLEVTEFLIYDNNNEIIGIEGIVRDVTEATLTKNRISSMLYHDSLTGISNRLHLEILMEKLIADTYANREEHTFTMLFIDLDHFKHINDTLGHDIGDLLLQQIAYSVSTMIRPNDIFARIGGDEFVIIFKGIKDYQIIDTIERLMKFIRQPWVINEFELSVSASIGIVTYPHDGVSTVELMKSADIAMYKSKSRGRNNYTFYEKQYDTSVNTEVTLVQDMSIALDKNEFSLHYQPKVLVKSNEVISSEALIRWEHPKIGYIAPDTFIPLAENTGLILRLGRWVIKEVCQTIAHFNTYTEEKVHRVSINISIRQFQHEDIYALLKENIEHFGIDGGQISLEITESIMMENHADMLKIINKIKTLNVGISLDDFGTGYSTLSYLNTLSIDELKIDKAFVDSIPKNGQLGNKSIILDTIIAMGKILDMLVVAEGVEHEYQRQYLIDKGCDIYQGFYFSKALPKEEYIAKHIA